MMQYKRKGAVKIGLGSVVLLILVFLLIAYSLGYLNLNNFKLSQIPPQPSQSQTSNLVSVTKPLKIAVVNPIAGASVPSASVKIYTGQQLSESLTTGSDGTVTTALPYSSGTTLNIQVISGSSKIWKAVSVPQMNPQDAQSLTTNFISISTFTLGTYTIKVTDQFGNTYISGGMLNFTALGVSTASLTITIYNTVDNTGYMSSFDPINNVNWQAFLVASTGGSSATYSGASQTVQRGTTTYYLNQISDSGLTRQKVGNTYTQQGVTSVTVTVGKGSLVTHTSNNQQAFTFTLYAYFDANYFATNGIGSPDAQSLATFSLTLAT